MTVAIQQLTLKFGRANGVVCEVGGRAKKETSSEKNPTWRRVVFVLLKFRRRVWDGTHLGLEDFSNR